LPGPSSRSPAIVTILAAGHGVNAAMPPAVTAESTTISPLAISSAKAWAIAAAVSMPSAAISCVAVWTSPHTTQHPAVEG
jgi:hypothetical protein